MLGVNKFCSKKREDMEEFLNFVSVCDLSPDIWREKVTFMREMERDRKKDREINIQDIEPAFSFVNNF